MDSPLESKAQEPWVQDGFESYEEYERYYCSLADDLYTESKEAWKPVKQRWMDADRRVELDSGSLGGPRKTSSTEIPIVPAAVEEAIALRIESLPRPSAQARQPNEDQMVSALNYFMGEELDMANFDMLMARVALDMMRFGIGCVKQTIDKSQTGPFGQPSRIVFSKVDPRHIWVDPFATGHRWEDMRYLVIAVPHDLEDIRKWFPVRGPLVPADPSYSSNREDADDNTPQRSSTFSYSSPFKDKSQSFTVGERRRALLKEVWIKDGRTKECPKLDDDGMPVFGEDGKQIMYDEPMYPNGRVIISAGDVVLLDVANPYRHKEPPYVFFPARVSSRFFTYGDVELLAKLEDKINILMKDLMKNARTNMNSPWLVDSGAFDSPEKYKNLTNDEGLVIIARPNARVMRVPPGEVPMFIKPLIDQLSGYFDNVLGIGGVQRGQLTEGAQLSAQAVESLQGASATRLRLKARLFETALEHLGYQLQWNIRMTYPSKMEIEIIDPSSGEPEKIYWNDEEAQDDYPVSIEAGSSLPGAKQGASSMAITLWGQDLIDRQKAVEMLNIPGGAVMLKRMEDRAEELAKLGYEADLKKNKTGSPGRKIQEITT